MASLNNRVGEVGFNKEGKEMEIVDYQNCDNVIVKFLVSGNCIHTQYGNFKRGKVKDDNQAKIFKDTKIKNKTPKQQSIKVINTHEMYKLNHRINNQGIVERRCTICENWLEENYDNFYMINKKKPELGYSSGCKICLTAKSIAHRLLNVERARKSIQDHYYRHKEIYNTRAKAYNKEHKDKVISDYKIWVKNNPDKVRIYTANHRDHDISEEEWRSCLSIFDYSCAYCSISEKDHLVIHGQVLHKEHSDPEGYNDLSNAIPACRRCNCGKHTSNMEEWYRKQDYFDKEMLSFIRWWLDEGHKEFIEDKPPYKVKRKRIEGLTTYFYQLWSVDEKRNTIEVLATGKKKKDLDIHIETLFKIIK